MIGCAGAARAGEADSAHQATPDIEAESEGQGPTAGPAQGAAAGETHGRPVRSDDNDSAVFLFFLFSFPFLFWIIVCVESTMFSLPF